MTQSSGSPGPDFIKIRVSPHNSAAYVSQKPDSRNLHHGEWKHSGDPITVLWSNGKWIEHPHDADCLDCRPECRP